MTSDILIGQMKSGPTWKTKVYIQRGSFGIADPVLEDQIYRIKCQIYKPFSTVVTSKRPNLAENYIFSTFESVTKTDVVLKDQNWTVRWQH